MGIWCKKWDGYLGYKAWLESLTASLDIRFQDGRPKSEKTRSCCLLRSESVHFFHTYKQKVDYVFVDHPTFLERVYGQTGSKLYGASASSKGLEGW